MLMLTRTAEDTRRATSERISSWSSSQASSRFRLHGRISRVNRSDSTAVPGTLILPPWQQNSGNKNIVVLVAFRASTSILLNAPRMFIFKCLSLSREKYRYSKGGFALGGAHFLRYNPVRTYEAENCRKSGRSGSRDS